MEFPSEIVAKMRPLARQICDDDSDELLPSLCLQALERWANEQTVVITDIARLEARCQNEEFVYSKSPSRLRIQSKRRWKKLYETE